MKIITNLISGLFDRLFALTFTLLLLQVPHVIQQYTTALSGALYESKKTVQSIKKAAKLNNKSIIEFIKKHLDNADPDFVASGKVMNQAWQRYLGYKFAIKKLRDANVWQKPFFFVSVVDWQLFHEMKYKPGISFSLEDIIYALLGLFLGLLIYHSLLFLLKKI